MKKIAVLGPEGTYSDIAARKYAEGKHLEIEYYPTILRTASAIRPDSYVILPFENTLDGFVIESLDQIILNNLRIIEQVKLDIDFAFVTNAERIEDVRYCYAQFKVQGQCLGFIMKNSFDVLTTNSNSETVNNLLHSGKEYGAIIPMHRLADTDFKTILRHVADSRANETRFFITTSLENEDYKKLSASEASVLVTIHKDRAGVLYDILKEFHDFDINLKSIMSRPMKTEMGQYKFYIECSLPENKYDRLEKVAENLSEMEGLEVTIMGIYNVL